MKKKFMLLQAIENGFTTNVSAQSSSGVGTLELSYAKEKNIVNYSIEGNLTLSGEPSIDSPADMVGVGDGINSYFEIMTIALAKAGQIEPIYLTNQEARKFLYLFVTCAFCFAGQGEETQEPFIFSPSLIRFFGNGAAEMLFLYGQNQNLIRYELEKKEK